jgi:hypothetical protein
MKIDDTNQSKEIKTTYLKWSVAFARFGTTLFASYFLWAVTITSISTCLNSLSLWSIYFGILMAGMILLYKKKIFQRYVSIWFFVFLFLNFTIGSFVAGKLGECNCARDKKYCDISDELSR